MRLVILVEAGWVRYREELARAGVLVTDRLEIWLADFDDAVPPELREQEEYLRAATWSRRRTTEPAGACDE